MNANDYIAQAIAQSYDNRPTVLTAEDPELLVQLSLLFQGYYRIAAKENPGALATNAVLTWNSTGWTIPADVDTTIRLERTNGVEVVVVPLEDRAAEPSVGAVYRLGRRYLPAGNSNDPSSLNLVIYYASIGPTFTAGTDEPGAEWPVQFDMMVVLDLAAYMARKDGRAQDYDALMAGNSSLPGVMSWRADFMRWCQTPDLNIRRRFGAPTVVPTPAVRPVGVGG